MKALLLFAIVLKINSSCSSHNHNQSNTPELKEIARFSLNKPVKFFVDSLQLNVDELTFIHEPPGIISSVSVDYSNKGTIEFFFEGTSIIEDNLRSKEYYLRKVAGKIIHRIEWENLDGKKGSAKNVIMY